MPPTPGDQSRPRDLLASCQEDLDLAMRDMDTKVGGNANADNRDHDRLQYQVAGGLTIEIEHPGGTNAVFRIHPHNLSASGIGFLHGAFVFPGSNCQVNIKMPSGQHQRVAGVVKRCTHVNGKIHDVGVQFDQLVEHGWYSSDDDAETTDEKPSELPSYAGSVMVFTPSKAERDLLHFMLTKLGLDVAAATKIPHAMRYVEGKTFQLILAAAWDGDDGQGLEFVRSLKEANCRSPIVGIVDGDEDREAAIAAGCLAVSGSIQDTETLIQLIDKYVVSRGAGANEQDILKSTRWDDVSFRPLILDFLDYLDQQLKILQQHLIAEDRDAFAMACRDICVTSRGYGYEPIRDISSQLQALAGSEEDIGEIQKTYRDLAQLAARATIARTLSS